MSKARGNSFFTKETLDTSESASQLDVKKEFYKNLVIYSMLFSKVVALKSSTIIAPV